MNYGYETNSKIAFHCATLISSYLVCNLTKLIQKKLVVTPFMSTLSAPPHNKLDSSMNKLTSPCLCCSFVHFTYVVLGRYSSLYALRNFYGFDIRLVFVFVFVFVFPRFGSQVGRATCCIHFRFSCTVKTRGRFVLHNIKDK